MKSILAAGLAAVVLTAPVRAQSGSVLEGSVRYVGPAVETRVHAISDEFPSCKREIEDETLVVDPDTGALKNAIVFLEDGSLNRDWAVQEQVTMDQIGCVFRPHVVVLPAGQSIVIRNSDGILHNFHTAPGKNRPVNLAMPRAMDEMEISGRKMRKPDFIRVKCDIHNWMSAVIAVAPHPFYAVTDENGTFRLEGIPAGTYELSVWHESLNPTTLPVTVGDGERQTLELKIGDDG